MPEAGTATEVIVRGNPGIIKIRSAQEDVSLLVNGKD